MSTQFVFVGYHRSGTSAITQNFAQANLFIGRDLLGVKESNPYGHFEDIDFLAINRAILESNSTNWKTKSSFTPVIKNDAYEIASELIAKRDSLYEFWGFKDPRTCLVLDFWHSLLSNPKYVVCLRHYSYCVDSIMRRMRNDYYSLEKKENAENIKLELYNFDSICLNWCVYMSSVLFFLKVRTPDFLIVNMDNVIDELSIVEQCNIKFGSNFKPIKLSETFDSRYFKNNKNIELNINPSLLRIANNIWNELVNIV